MDHRLAGFASIITVLLLAAAPARSDQTMYPAGYPDDLRHQNAPLPNWDRLGSGVERSAHLARILPGGREQFDAWPAGSRRLFALFFDTVLNEGWLDAVGPVRGAPAEDGLRFSPPASRYGLLAERLDGKAEFYTANSISNGLFTYATRWNHKNWYRAWMRSDVGRGSLHVGLTNDGEVEAHFEIYNPLWTRGAPAAQLISAPGLGVMNKEYKAQHQYWENDPWTGRTRTSANLYYLLRDRVPLSF